MGPCALSQYEVKRIIFSCTRWCELTIDLNSPTVTIRLPSSRERILATGVSLFESLLVTEKGSEFMLMLLCF